MLKTQYEIHPAATVFPMMTEAEYQGLKQDIAENGQREDITMWCGKIIDGRNRLRACEELGRTPHIADLDEDTDPWKYVISHNLHRRHLTTSQRSDVAAKMATLRHGDNQHTREDGHKYLSSIDEAASQLNVSPMSVKNAKTVIANGSAAVNEALEQGNLPVTLAAKFVKAVPDKREQTKILNKGIKSVRDACKSKDKPKPKANPEPLEIVWEDVEEQPVGDCKLEEFKRFWEKCSDISKVAIRIWISEN